jgi:hypothetical protein
MQGWVMPIIRVVGGDDEPEDFGEVDQSVVRRRNPYRPSQLEVTVATGLVPKYRPISVEEI